MKALSIRQPWAWLIVHADKNIENRTWRCHYRGPIAIHASKLPASGKRYEQAIDDFYVGKAMALKGGVNLRKLGPVTMDMLVEQSGAIVGTARIVDCVTEGQSPWFVGPFGIVLEDVRPTPIIPCRGALGLWTVPPDVERQMVQP
jgi:hypothetical protein